jgi:hypothetical protein
MRDRNIAVSTATGRGLLRNTIAIALVLCAAAVPGYCSTSFLTFSGTNPATGTIQVTGDSTSESLTSLSGISYQTLVVSNALDANDDGTWSLTGALMGLSSNTLTLNGTIGSCTAGACLGGGTNLGGISGNLEQIVLSGLPYNTGAGSGFTTNNPSQTSINIAFGAPTSITDLATLLTAIDGGSNFSVSTAETSGSIVGTGSGTAGTGGVYTFGGTSEGLGLTLTETPATTPEPVSFIMLGSGLLGIGAIVRRRSAKA